jgi:hypothetical protein
MQKNLGTFKPNTIIHHHFLVDKEIMAATASCGCLNLRIGNKKVSFSWKMPEFPFQITKDTLNIQQSIEVTYLDYSKEIFTFEAILLK